MIRRIVMAVAWCLIYCVFNSPVKADVLVIGESHGCFSGKTVQYNDVLVYIFDVARVPRLLGLISEIERAEAQTRQEIPSKQANERYFQLDQELVQTVKSSPKLARKKADEAGVFSARIAGASKNLLIFGLRETDEGPGNYAYERVTVRSPTQQVVLKFFPGRTCGTGDR
jgi:hypothetical protein